MEKQSAFEPPSSVATEPVKKGKARKLVAGAASSPRRPSDFSCHKMEDDPTSLHGGFAQIAFVGKDEECSVYISPSSGQKQAVSGVANAPNGIFLHEL